MLVTFRSEAYADITMFGDIAVSLLRQMGMSGDVPGAIRPEDIPAALQRLETSLARQAAAAQEPPAEEGEEEAEQAPPVSLGHRALPLIELLRASAKSGCDVMWVRG